MEESQHSFRTTTSRDETTVTKGEMSLSNHDGNKLCQRKKDLFPGAKFGPRSHQETNHSISSIDYGTIISLSIALPLFILLPYIHFDVVYSLWNQYTRPVNRSTCFCNCWDSTFKSNYEAGVPNYKHVYFNITSNSSKIWIMTVLAILATYESIRKATNLAINRRLNSSMFLLFACSIYPHYYSWWAFFNFWNDDYYWQWYHQSLFAITEILSTFFVVQLMDTQVLHKSWKLVVILDIAIMHTLVALTDQFGYNVLRGEGELHQILRDVGFMVPDVLHIIISLKQLSKYAKQQRVPIYTLVSNRLFSVSVGFVIFTWVISIYL